MDKMESYDDLIADALTRVREIMPWDLSRSLTAGNKPILLDVREAAEYAMLRIPIRSTFRAVYWNNHVNGIMTRLCPNWQAGGSRRSWSSVVQVSAPCWRLTSCCGWGFTNVVSLKTGVRGWNDFEQPMENANGETIDADAGDVLLAPRLRPEQRKPKSP
jgi:rhodanese-related sulfurtransferase